MQILLPKFSRNLLEIRTHGLTLALPCKSQLLLIMIRQAKVKWVDYVRNQQYPLRQ